MEYFENDIVKKYLGDYISVEKELHSQYFENDIVEKYLGEITYR